jgi:dTDP-4-amino-4,6-dideoxygalactose transaminase
MAVPLLDVNAQNLPLEEELTETFVRVLRSGRFILGEEVEAFEAECAAVIGAAHGISVSSGTDALLAVFMALGIGPGDEVLCPAFTFFATAGSIARTGATPVFCDVSPEGFLVDLESAAGRVTGRTKAIVPVHLFGQSADMERIGDFAAKHGLQVVEDVAQSIGATRHGAGCGTRGIAGCFSFFPSKNLGGFGDGGLISTNDRAFAERLFQIRNHGMFPRYHHSMIGGNFRLDALQCALLRIKLRQLDRYAAARSNNARYYTERLSLLPDVSADPLSGSRLILPSALPGNEHAWNQFTLRVPGEGRRDALMAWLSSRGIGCEIYYPIPLHQQECFRSLPEHAIAPCPVSESLAREVLSIPVFPELDEAQLDEVASAIEGWLAS